MVITSEPAGCLDSDPAGLRYKETGKALTYLNRKPARLDRTQPLGRRSVSGLSIEVSEGQMCVLGATMADKAMN